MTTHTLTIRYNNLATTPAVHGARGYGVDVPMIQTVLDDGYWTLTSGDRYPLVAHVQRATAAGDLHDCRLNGYPLI